MSQKFKAKTITSIQFWVDDYSILASTYVTAHLEFATGLLKYMSAWGHKGQNLG